MPYERLSRDPVVEAILEIRAEDGDALPPEVLRAFVEAVADAYPRVEVPGRKVQAEEEGEPSAEGYVAFAADSKSAVQARPAGLFFNRMKPYPGWDAFKAEGERLWREFARHVPVDWRPATIGLRYINQLDLDFDQTGERRILRVWPWPEGSVIQRRPSRYYMRVDAPTGIDGIHADVAHALEVSEDGESVRILIENGMRATAASNPAVWWERFDDLHDTAHQLFRDTFTDETYESFR